MKQLTALAVLALFISTVMAQQRIPLIEEFSSSTCPPCKTFNDETLTPFLQNASNAGKYTIVNYRMYWPGTGDPYNTAEATARKNAYGVSYAPDCFIDSLSHVGGPLSNFTAVFNSEYAKAAKATITATHWITGASVATGKAKVRATITPTQTISGASLYVAVLEKLTTGNVATNGETQFHYVMMKMVPNASGRSLTLSAGTPVTITDSASLAGTHIEQMSDLAVAVWVQISATREVLQSAWATVGTAVEYRPVSNAAQSVPHIRNMTVYNAKNTVISVYDLSGRQIAAISSAASAVDLAKIGLSNKCLFVRISANNGTSSHMVNNVR
jgi:hypothetical protein